MGLEIAHLRILVITAERILLRRGKAGGKQPLEMVWLILSCKVVVDEATSPELRSVPQCCYS